jgi:D-arabinose 1-dehydrogenase-like Zn-dependent alcohol dehydrogenase
MGSAAILGAAGLALEAVAAVSAMRRRIAAMDAPPKELAKRQWARYAAIVRAAGEEWRRDAAARTMAAPARPAATTRRPTPAHEHVGV